MRVGVSLSLPTRRGATKNSALDRLCRYLAEDPTSPTQKYTPADSDLDAVIDVRVIFQQGNRALEIADMPTLLLPRKGDIRTR